ncbi:TetR/AcrR family transcriptional regulator [Nocardioides sp. LHD-245]|uniref:TetR/AcrR family transcriptional regulator n=1 Tax=Nocardioides sp. LHD-245 TaxID=3051387 RepID=UPI0027DFBE3A|nr:TetR/AcrR family transcriptional regulator [Nocardioides sp. LHD-245]
MNPAVGRPRSSGADEAILRAGRELMTEHGYAGFSMDEVARRAGVGRQSVYRRWPSKPVLVVAAMTSVGADVDVFADTGSFEGDLRSGLEAMRALYHRSSAALFADVYFAMASDLAARDLFNENHVRPRRRSLARAVERAIERGELARETDVSTVTDLVSGPFLYRRLIAADDLRDVLLDAIVEAVLLLYGAKPQQSSATIDRCSPA